MMNVASPKAPSRRAIVKVAGALAAGIAAPAFLRVRSAHAAYPDRPVRVVVANSPGGPSDIIARIMASALQEKLSCSFVVENKGGAGGNIGMGYVANARMRMATRCYWQRACLRSMRTACGGFS